MGHVERMGEMRNAYKIFIVKPDENRFTRYRPRWKENITWILQK